MMIKDKRSKITKFAHTVEWEDSSSAVFTAMMEKTLTSSQPTWQTKLIPRPTKSAAVPLNTMSLTLCPLFLIQKITRTVTRMIVESEETDDDETSENDNDNSAMEPYSPHIPLTLSLSPINEDAFATTESPSHSNNPAGEKKWTKVILGKEGTREGTKDAAISRKLILGKERTREGTKDAAISRKLYKFTSKIPMCNSIFSARKGSREKRTS